MTSCNDDELVERLGNLGLGVNRELPNFDWEAIFDARDRIVLLTEQLKEAENRVKSLQGSMAARHRRSVYPKK